MDVRRFMTIKAVEEQAIGTWNIGNRGHAFALSYCKKMHDVPHSIADPGSEITPEHGFDFSSSDLVPNARGEPRPEAEAKRKL